MDLAQETGKSLGTIGHFLTPAQDKPTTASTGATDQATGSYSSLASAMTNKVSLRMSEIKANLCTASGYRLSSPTSSVSLRNLATDVWKSK